MPTSVPFKYCIFHCSLKIIYLQLCKAKMKRLNHGNLSTHRCDDSTIKKLMSYFGNKGKDDHKKTIVELVKRLSKLTEQLEMKGKEVKQLETNMEEVNIFGC